MNRPGMSGDSGLTGAVQVLTLDVAAGLRVGRHAHQRDAVQDVVGCPVAAAGQSVAGDFVKSEMPQAAYRWQGHGG